MYNMNGIEVLDMHKDVYEIYKRITKGNKNITYDEAKRKLTRNVLLGKRVYRNTEKRIEYIMYGTLKIQVNTSVRGNRRIVGVWNHCRPDHYWILHEKNYKKISKKLGLEINGDKKHVTKGVI